MITITRYKRSLNKLIPVRQGRYNACKRAGFVRNEYIHNSLHKDIQTTVFRIQYLEFIRYNITTIEFYLL